MAGTLRHSAAINNLRPCPPQLAEAFAFVELITNDYNQLRTQTYSDLMERIYQDFWNNNNPIDYGVVIKDISIGQSILFTLDTSNVLLYIFRGSFLNKIPSTEDVSHIISFLNSMKYRGNEFSESPALKEFIDFMNQLKFNPDGIPYDFKYLKPGKMLSDFSNFKWEIQN